MWHMSSHSGVATLQTAMHLLLTYLLTSTSRRRLQGLVLVEDSLQLTVRRTGSQLKSYLLTYLLTYFDAVGWVSGRASGV